MKHPAELTYAVIRLRGATRRYLFCRTEEKPYFGEPSFDFMSYFGFGSGEFEGEHPPEFDNLRVRVEPLEFGAGEDSVGLKKAALANWFSRPTDGFSGFFTHDGIHFFTMKQDDDGVPLTHLKALNWHYYTNIGGDRKTALSHLAAMDRRHFLFKTYEEQSTLLGRYAELAVAI